MRNALFCCERTVRKQQLIKRKEAKEYCSDLDGCKYVAYVNVFAMYDKPVEGAEIFSSMQKSDLKPKEYLERHYPNQPDDCKTVGETHRWYNVDDKRSACYHCNVVKED